MALIGVLTLITLLMLFLPTERYMIVQVSLSVLLILSAAAEVVW